MEDLFSFVVILIIIISVLKNIAEKLTGGKDSPSGDDEGDSVARQLRELMQDEETDSSPGREVSRTQPPRPTARPTSQPVSRTQPPRPTARPTSQPVSRTQPPRPTVRPADQPVSRTQPPRPIPSPKPSPAPKPVRIPQGQPLGRQVRTETVVRKVTTKPESAPARPIHARPQMDEVQSKPLTPPKRQSRIGTEPVAPVRDSKGQIDKAKRLPGRRPKRRTRGIGIHLNRKNLGTAVVITEIMNPPIALRGENMPWDA